MDRISAANYALNAAGKRVFVNKNLATNTAGTTQDATWQTGVQESIIGVVEGSGQTPTDADNSQLFKAIRAIGGANVTPFAASGTLTALQAGVVEINAASGPVTITRPLAAALGGLPYRYTFYRIDATANAVTIADAGSDYDLPGFVTSLTLPANTLLTVQSDGSNWLEPVAYATPASVTAAITAAIGALPVPMCAESQVNSGGGSATATASFTAGGPGILVAIGARNNSNNSGSGYTGALSINGAAGPSDNTVETMVHMTYAATSGGAVYATYTASSSQAFSSNVVLIFIPNP